MRHAPGQRSVMTVFDGCFRAFLITGTIYEKQSLRGEIIRKLPRWQVVRMGKVEWHSTGLRATGRQTARRKPDTYLQTITFIDTNYLSRYI